MEHEQNKLQRQMDLEDRMSVLGKERYAKRLAASRQHGHETDVTPVNYLMQVAIEPLTRAIAEFTESAKSGKAGRRHTAIKFLEGLEPEAVAMLTARTVLDCISNSERLAGTCIKIGTEIENERWFRAFSTQKSGLWSKIVDSLIEEGAGRGVLQDRLKRAARTYDVQFERIAVRDRFLIGTKLLELFEQTSGFIKRLTLAHGKTTDTYVEATPELDRWLQNAHSNAAVMSPIYQPMVIPPLDWTTPFDGGYLSNSFRRRPLIRNHNKAYLEDAAHSDLEVVYEAVNALQRTSWRINRKVLEVINTLYESGSQVGKLPSSIRDDEVPPFPVSKDDKEAVDRWRAAARRVREGNAKRRSKRVALSLTLSTAADFQNEPEFFFPYFLDFRGRAYPQAGHLNPQGADWAKALLEFAEGKPLGEQGACWLAIHGANLWGYDKADLNARIEWVEEHEREILASAKEPLDNTWWAQADKPFCFLAFCFEWAAFCEEGFDYVSHMPVAMDGSCNGLQNFSMALRDEVGGSAVNLVPSDKPADVYQRVADVVLEKLRGMEEPMAQQWIASGLVTRKLCKKPVMTLPYGAKQYGMRSGLADYIREQKEEGKQIPWDDDHIFSAAAWIAKVIWGAIEEVVVAARQAMDFLQKTATAASREGLPITWFTPDGFPVQQAYVDRPTKRIITTMGGKRVDISIVTDADEFIDHLRNGDEEPELKKHKAVKLDRRKQSAGISPNFVHSLDGCHMRMTTRAAMQWGITHLAMVHDSFATHASQAELLGDCLRVAFVEMYRNDVLEEFRTTVTQKLSPKNAADVPPCPPNGTLDAEAVINSKFFFA